MNILDLLSSRGIRAKRVASTFGGEYHSPCPICGGRDRFQAWPNRGDKPGGCWKCRGCGQGGDLIAFLREVEGLTFRDACARLGLESELPMRPLPHPARNVTASFTPAGRCLPSAQWRERAAKLVGKAYDSLWDNSKVIHALALRGVEHTGVLAHRLGWLDGENGKDCLYRPRSVWGLPDLVEEREGRTIRKRTLWIPRGLVIPRFLNGEVVSLRIRRPDADVKRWGDKYYVVTGGRPLPLVVGPGHKLPALAHVVVESELDALMVADMAGRAGLPVGAVAVLSAAGKPCPQTHVLLKNSAAILIALDYDAAGAKAAVWWLDTYPQAKRWPVPEAKDPGDYYKLGGCLAIAEWIRKGLPEGLLLRGNPS